MPNEEHEQGAAPRDVVRDDELLDLLDRLHAEVEVPPFEPAEPRGTTLSDVVEATGFSYAEVQQALEGLREERLARVLNELEEPTHRVERPGHTPNDPASRLRPANRHGAFRSILDDLPRVGMVVLKPKRERTKEDLARDEEHHRVSMLVLYGLLGLMALLVLGSVLVGALR